MSHRQEECCDNQLILSSLFLFAVSIPLTKFNSCFVKQVKLKEEGKGTREMEPFACVRD